jgi:sortase A
MNLRTSPPLPWVVRKRRRIRWARRLLLTTGIVLLGYVGLTLLDARYSQASAKHTLDTQIQSQQQIRSFKKDDPSQATPPVNSGDVLGRIDIPRLGMSFAVLQGTSWRILRLGAGHIEGTPLPGEPGNSGIAGHRDTFFRELRKIHEHDEIHLQTATGLLHYQVDWVKVVQPDDVSVLTPSTDSTLTLVTCYPFYFVGSASQRFVVHARKN